MEPLKHTLPWLEAVLKESSANEPPSKQISPKIIAVYPDMGSLATDIQLHPADQSFGTFEPHLTVDELYFAKKLLEK